MKNMRKKTWLKYLNILNVPDLQRILCFCIILIIYLLEFIVFIRLTCVSVLPTNVAIHGTAGHSQSQGRMYK